MVSHAGGEKSGWEEAQQAWQIFPVGLQGARTVFDGRTVELWIKPFTDLGIAIPISLHIHLGIHALEIHFLSLGLQFPSIPYTFWG